MVSIFMVSQPDWFRCYIDKIQQLCPAVEINRNFEDIKARAKELSRVVVMFGGYNYSKDEANIIGVQDTITELHRKKADLPILGWNLIGEEIRKANEIVLVIDDYSLDDFYSITERFLKGTLTLESIPAPRPGLFPGRQESVSEWDDS